jgi:ubiquinone/menaquinone biosynthesis C-methylase UbiE
LLVSFVRATWRRRRYLVALELLGDVSGQLLLDVGSGSGEFLIGLGGSAWVVGVEVAPHGKPSFILVHGDAERLPFRNDCFSVVTCFEVIEHVRDPESVIGEIHRVLRKKGVLVLSTPDASLVWRLIWYVWTHTFGREWLHAHSVRLRLRDLLSLLKGRFSVESYKRANFFIITVRARALKK